MPMMREQFRATATLLLGVSGGADSMCMLYALAQLRRPLKAELHVIHVNHRTRGAESNADEKLVEEFCRSQNIPFSAEGISGSRTRGETREEFFRRERYRIFNGLAAAVDATHLALAHTADDLAESLLMNLLRGAGLRGLGNFSPVQQLGNLHVVRPMWRTSRAAVLRYAKHHNVPYRDDATNQDLDHTRNRIRHELLPFLEEKFNPNVRKSLLLAACSLQDAYQMLQQQAAEQLDAIVTGTDARSLSIEKLINLPRPLFIEVVRQWVVKVAPLDVLLNAERLSQIERFVRAPRTTHLRLANNMALETRDGNLVLIHSTPSHTATFEPIEILTQPLKRGKDVTVQLPSGLLQISLESGNATDLPDRLQIRTRLPGDKLSPRVKLKDVLINDKVPKAVRETMVVIAAEDGTILHVIDAPRINARIATHGKPILQVTPHP